jgi:hypothetical protein
LALGAEVGGPWRGILEIRDYFCVCGLTTFLDEELEDNGALVRGEGWVEMLELEGQNGDQGRDDGYMPDEVVLGER